MLWVACLCKTCEPSCSRLVFRRSCMCRLRRSQPTLGTSHMFCTLLFKKLSIYFFVLFFFFCHDCQITIIIKECVHYRVIRCGKFFYHLEQSSHGQLPASETLVSRNLNYSAVQRKSTPLGKHEHDHQCNMFLSSILLCYANKNALSLMRFTLW